MRVCLKNVTRRFGGFEAVSDVTVAAEAGEVVCLLGPSGCGKSTTLRIAAGVDRQDEGVVFFDGELASDARRHTPPEDRGVGLMFQDLALFPHLTALQNVMFGLRRGGRGAAAAFASSAEKRAWALRELDRLGLANRADAFPHELSGGEQQRVALARAVAPRPRVMLMDEPFSALDPRLRDVIRDEALGYLKESGAAVLLVTHDPNEALRMADRIALMRAGRIVQIGTPQALYDQPVDRFTAEFFSDVNIVHGVVRSGAAETPFGRFAAPNLVDETQVELIFRPQHLRLAEEARACAVDPLASAVVSRARFMGPHMLVEARLEADGTLVRMVCPVAREGGPPARAPGVGERVDVALRRERSHLFPCERQSRVATPYITSVGGVGARLQAADRPASADGAPTSTLAS